MEHPFFFQAFRYARGRRGENLVQDGREGYGNTNAAHNEACNEPEEEASSCLCHRLPCAGRPPYQY